ncbi:unnamed protein product [Phyllotreta striolata]|uniref:E3 ubiquitin-protein ligase RBBP6 n=1 Tax=Phyllotreta striolata TaxID=444603 RepID=A0A9N9TK79_PHYSR|nr:unnamed protein product [Phyllotreta striolata]
MSVHYKFKSALEYDTVTFDGLHISVKDLKNAILQQKRIGKSTDFDLQVTNAQTKEVYEDENALIQKNASLLIARIPVIPQKNKSWEGYGGDNTPPQTKLDEGGPVAKEVDLSSLDAPEDDKIRAMMSQSTQDYDPSNYIKLRGANQVGAVPPNYRCYKCHQGGHWIKDCTFALGAEPVEIKKSTGIPRSFMIAVEGPQVPGAMMTPNGQFAVPLVDHQAYNQKPAPAIAQTPKTDIPEDLLCNICSDLLTDAVMIPCCGNSFCDECIRGVLLESEDHECPDCHEKDISPDTLIPNRFLRTSVSNFKNTTGYVKVPSQRPPKAEVAAILKEESALKPEIDQEKHTVISEADSTELIKSQNTDNIKKNENDSVEGPPGVSPKSSPRDHRKYRELSPRSPRERRIRRKSRSLSRSISPRRSPRRRRTRSRSKSRSRDRRSGTPTVDEPLASNNFPSNYATSTIGTVGPIQGHPPPIPGNFPAPIGTFPAQGPPPSYRYPPPAGGAPYMPPGPYSIPPRGMFDVTRPPIGGPPPNFQGFPPRNHRDYNRRMLDRAPPGVIDDPLAAFNRLLREKDEQKRRAKQRGFRRSYSRSRSRSRSYSRSPIRRRSRSPRPSRRSRSRSRSFSLSRSRSRSFSGSLRGSPHRQLSPARRSPPPGAPRRGSRYRSPLRSPPRSRIRDRDYDDDRDYDRHDRRDNRRGRERRSPRDRDRDRDRYYDNYDDKRGGVAPSRGHQAQWNQPRSDGYFPPAPQPLQTGYQPNRFGPARDFGPPFMNKDPPPFSQPLPQTIHSIQPQRQYQDVAPPGVDDDIAPPGVDEYNKPAEKKEPAKKEEKPDKRKDSADRKRRHDKRSRTPDKRKSRSKEREKDSPDKHKRRRRESSEDRKKDHSDDEKTKKNKDKKKHKDKKETEKKKKRDKKDKHKKDKESKDKKSKEEFRQIIPKHTDDEDDDDKKEKKQHGGDRKRSDKDKHKKIDKPKDANAKEERIEHQQQETHAEIIDKSEAKDPINDNKADDSNNKSSEKKEPESNEAKAELYDDASTDIDPNVLENYRKINNDSPFEGREDGVNKPPPDDDDETEITEDGEIKDVDEEKDVLELHSTDLDLKTELDKSDILAPVPEKSKWEVDDDGAAAATATAAGAGASPDEDSSIDKNGKVTNEVLKRAENAIFAKAINAIRPIEIKKIGNDRAKLYSGDKEPEKIVQAPAKIEPPPVRLSVKERLGVKVDDANDKVINLSRRSNTVSPFSRRGELGRNASAGEKRPHQDSQDDRRKRSRSRRSSRERRRQRSDDGKSYRRGESARSDHKRDKTKKDKQPKKVEDDEKKSKRKRSRTRSQSKDKLKRKEKKPKREKAKKKDEDEGKIEDQKDPVGSLATSKRKATIDEANFEPDYDESHSDDEDEKKAKRKPAKKESERSSSSESGSSSSSQEERKKSKKRKKHRKKKRKESSTESSSEESESSDSDKDRKRKKHRKTKKKKKKSKRKT